MQKNRGFLLWESSFVCLLLFDSWETDCVWFGKIASLFARVCKLLLGIPPESGSARLEHIPSLPGKPQLPLKPCISLQPFYFKRQLRFLRFSLRFQCVLINTSVKEGSLPSLTNHLAELSQLDRSSPSAVMRLLRLLNEWLASAKSNQ